MSPVPPPKRHPYAQWSPDTRALDLVGDKWTLLIVRDLAGGPRRFVDLQRTLPGISTEQLRSRLNRMVADALLTRKRYREVPPRVDYELTERGRDLFPVLGALARWGAAWAWGEPRPGEHIDVGAILRLAPGLARPRRGLRGTVGITVTGRSTEPATRAYAVRFGTARVAIHEKQAPEAEARMTGSERDWIAALGPGADRSALSIEGDETLVSALLDALHPQGAAAAGAADVA